MSNQTGRDAQAARQSVQASTRRQYGDHAACGRCEADIEWHGRDAGWSDRGGNCWCDTSGMSWRDQDGVTMPYPHRKHSPSAVFPLPAGAYRPR